MPTGLRRLHHTGDLHAINFNCFRKRPILATPEARNTFLSILEGTPQKHIFDVLAYAVMPNHVHLLLSEPAEVPLSTAIQVLKQRFSRTRIEDPVWERRYYDFNIYSGMKLAEKLNYMHMNPVTANLTLTPADYPWTSYRAHTFNEPGPVKITPLL